METNKLTEEILQKVKGAGSAKELVDIAKECGCTMTKEEAEKLFDTLQKTGELDEEALNTVTGGFLFGAPKQLGDIDAVPEEQDKANKIKVKRFI